MRKRTFSELRFLLLNVLSSGQQTTNQLSLKSGINWKTVEAHLTFLIGKRFVSEVLKSEYVRIFALTQAGEQYAKSLKQDNFETEISPVETLVSQEVMQP